MRRRKIFLKTSLKGHYLGGRIPLLAAPAYVHGLRDVVTRSRSDRSALQPLSRNRPRLTLGAYCSQTENSVAHSLGKYIRFGLHVIARSKATKQSIAGSSSTPSNGRSIAALEPAPDVFRGNALAANAHGSRNEPCGMNCSLSCRT
ncbi:hypothetical protein SAMN05720470_101457 [Fibrobacter sp. UWOV1]|nr:hypothetical protein SAMN05720470_101457 [Fibrobacter sp. UWOV1]